MSNHPELVRLKDLPSIIPVAERTLQRWAAQGRFPQPCIRTGKVTAWLMSDVLRWLEMQREQQLREVRR